MLFTTNQSEKKPLTSHSPRRLSTLLHQTNTTKKKFKSKSPETDDLQTILQAIGINTLTPIYPLHLPVYGYRLIKTPTLRPPSDPLLLPESLPIALTIQTINFTTQREELEIAITDC
jgi:hypothetical protein